MQFCMLSCIECITPTGVESVNRAQTGKGRHCSANKVIYCRATWQTRNVWQAAEFILMAWPLKRGQVRTVFTSERLYLQRNNEPESFNCGGSINFLKLFESKQNHLSQCMVDHYFLRIGSERQAESRPPFSEIMPTYIKGHLLCFCPVC